MSTLIIVLAWLIVVAVILYVVNKYIPMDATIKNIINAIVIIAVVLFLAYKFLPAL